MQGFSDRVPNKPYYWMLPCLEGCHKRDCERYRFAPKRKHIFKWLVRLQGWIHCGSLTGVHLSCSCRRTRTGWGEGEHRQEVSRVIFGYLELNWESVHRKNFFSKIHHLDRTSDCGPQHQENTERSQREAKLRLGCGKGFAVFRRALCISSWNTWFSH